MENQEPRSHARLAVSILLLVVIGASVIGAAYLQPKSTPARESTSTSTGVPSSEIQSTSCLSQSSTSSSNTSLQESVATPVSLNVYFNGSIFQGPMMGFGVSPGSHSTVHVMATYPWASFPSMPHDTCIPVAFAIGPFPANSNGSTIPTWLHVSLSSPLVAMVYGSSSSVNLLIGTDDSAPQGAIGSFELQVTYTDPASGETATDVNVLNLLASASTSAITRLTGACCSVNVTSLTLAAPTNSGGTANVTLAIANKGYYPAGYFEAFIENGTFPMSNNPPPSSGILFYNGTIPANETKTMSFSVPSSTIIVVPGNQYTVRIEVYYLGSAGGRPFQFSNYQIMVTAAAG